MYDTDKRWFVFKTVIKSNNYGLYKLMPASQLIAGPFEKKDAVECCQNFIETKRDNEYFGLIEYVGVE